DVATKSRQTPELAKRDPVRVHVARVWQERRVAERKGADLVECGNALRLLRALNLSSTVAPGWKSSLSSTNKNQRTSLFSTHLPLLLRRYWKGSWSLRTAVVPKGRLRRAVARLGPRVANGRRGPDRLGSGPLTSSRPIRVGSVVPSTSDNGRPPRSRWFRRAP